MTPCFIAPIVEGKGEVEAVPILLRRLSRQTRPSSSLLIGPALRVKVGSFRRDEHYFRRYLELACRKAQGHPRGLVLILLDCEDDCVGQLGPWLLARARQVHAHVALMVVLAHREYETWFLAAAASLRSVGDLPANLDPPPQPEAIRGAKEWLANRMPGGYDPIIHQPLFTQHFSLDQASTVDSFARFRRQFQSFIGT